MGHRLFFAIWPDAPARQKLAALATRMAETTGGRATPESNIHLTLEFLGEIAEERLPLLHQIAAGVRGRAFELSLDRLGAFRHARVAWAGATSAPAALLEFHAALSSALAAADFRLEERPFAPHVTLARKTESKLAPETIEAIAWKVAEFSLVRSHAGRYATLASWRLASR